MLILSLLLFIIVASIVWLMFYAKRQVSTRIFLGAVVVAASFPLLGFSYFSYIDYCSMPIWIAPSVVKGAVDKHLSHQVGERALLVNFDAFDYEHINVITTSRVFSLSSLTSDVSFDMELGDIEHVQVDTDDPRCLIIRAGDGEQHSMFFVGENRKFCDRLSAIIVDD